MTNTTDNPIPETAGEELPDARPALMEAADAAAALFVATDEADFAKPTPCEEFNVGELLDHLVLVARRLTAMAREEPWHVVQPEAIAKEQRVAEMTKAVDELRSVWASPDRLGVMMEAPFATLPGAAIAAVYTGEFLTHAWDLAAATGRAVSLSESTLHVGLDAIQFVPAEGRDADDMPFGQVVELAEDAPLIEQIVAWTGRDPHKWA